MTTRQLLTRSLAAFSFGANAANDVLWTPQNVAAGAGRISDLYDIGASPRPRLFAFLAATRWAATPAANDRLSLYLIQADTPADATRTVGAFTPGDAALASENELIANAQPFGVVLATATDKLFLAAGIVEIPQRYFLIAGWNGSATKALTNTASDHWISFMPLVDELQSEI